MFLARSIIFVPRTPQLSLNTVRPRMYCKYTQYISNEAERRHLYDVGEGFAVGSPLVKVQTCDQICEASHTKLSPCSRVWAPTTGSSVIYCSTSGQSLQVNQLQIPKHSGDKLLRKFKTRSDFTIWTFTVAITSFGSSVLTLYSNSRSYFHTVCCCDDDVM